MARTWAFVIPRGDWVDSYSTTNGKIILGMRLAALFVAFILGLIIGILVLSVLGRLPEKVPWTVIQSLLELLGWFIAGILGLGVAQFVSKRMTADAEIVKAESNAKIAEAIAPGTVTTTTSVSSAPAGTAPTQPTIP
jgi:uncharacterized membrane protein SpoIIM required for sporulation